jgi:signal transduction histidine kinase
MVTVRHFLLSAICLFPILALAQGDTSYLKSLYDRSLDFDESKKDSICFYASYIEKESLKLSFYKGAVLSLRLKGLCQEFQTDYEKAIDFYLQSLEEARRIKEIAYEISALSDLAIAYSAIHRPLEAKKFYLQCAQLAAQTREISKVVTSLNNLGVIYSQLEQYDSALIFLNDALLTGEAAGGQIDPSSTYNNIGNAYFKKKLFIEALRYFKRNYGQHMRDTLNGAPLWTDHINLADTYTELRRFDSATFHAAKALQWAVALAAKSKEADSYSMLARLNERIGNYSKAYKYLTQWYALDTAMVNENTQKSIAGLQERFYAKERNAQNKLLMERIEKEKYRNQNMKLLAIALGIIGILIAIAFMIKRTANRRLLIKNKLINKQNERLAELNQEKNSLISIVSHDLGTPFAAIHVWGQILETDAGNLNAEQQKALQRIIQAGHHGQLLIKRILDVEKSELGNYSLQLEQFDLVILVESIIESFKPVAVSKQIKLHFQTSGMPIVVLSDKQLVQRMIENLVSNAIKYSLSDRSVYINLSDEEKEVHVHVRDEGLGINKEELPLLFSKYAKISSQPTAGEPSTGLGLSIVKRIADEIDAKIICETEKGKGSIFTIILKK